MNSLVKFLRRNDVKWGLTFFIVTLGWMVFERLMGWHGPKIELQEKLTMLFMIPAIGVYVLGLLDKKKNDLKGRMTWKQGFIAGLKITLVAWILAPLAQYLTSVVISPDYFDNVINYLVTVRGKDRTEMEAFFNLKNYLMHSVIGTPVMGAATSALVALFTRTRKK